MDLGRQREVLGAAGDGALEVDEGGGTAGLEVEQGTGDEIGEDPDGVVSSRVNPASASSTATSSAV